MSTPDLTIYFQGLCAFVRNDNDVDKTNEVTVILVDAHRSRYELCEHHPLLTFRGQQVHEAGLPIGHYSAANPSDKNAGAGLRDIGIIPIAGHDVVIHGAKPRRLRFTNPDPKVVEFGAKTGTGQIDPAHLAPQPDPSLLVGSRVFLTDGTLQPSYEVEHYWKFAEEHLMIGEGETGEKFAQELRYEFRATGDARRVTICFKSFREPIIRYLTLETPGEIAITNLCPRDSQNVPRKERDFLAYYQLVTGRIERVVIPHWVPGDSRVGQSACPPTTLHL